VNEPTSLRAVYRDEMNKARLALLDIPEPARSKAQLAMDLTEPLLLHIASHQERRSIDAARITLDIAEGLASAVGSLAATLCNGDPDEIRKMNASMGNAIAFILKSGVIDRVYVQPKP
jgi:hypothetical protein